MERTQHIDTLIDEAAIIFKTESKSTYRKFKYLPEWVNAEANYFQSERRHQNRNYKIYQRGALVMVDFGIGIGGELSGNHFAVVLNKNDSPRNRVLTVVPISSKHNKYTIEIDGLIRDKSQKEINTIRHKLQQNFNIKHFNCLSNEIEVPIDEAESFIQDFYRHQNDLDRLQKLYDSYERFNKKSYAKCADITTISKDRIIYINEYDPCGKIKVSIETLDKLDIALRQNFIFD